MKKLILGVLLFPVLIAAQTAPYAGKINHLVVIIQENRSFDYYFGHLPGVPGYPVTTGMLNGTPIALTLQDPYINYNDPSHNYLSIVSAIDGGLMDRFPHSGANAYAYCDSSCIPFYYDMASRYGLAVNYWPQRGPSWPTHYGFIAAPRSPGDLVDNPNNVSSAVNRWTCFYNSCGGPGCKYPASGLYPIVNDILNYPANTGTSIYHAGVCSETRSPCTSTNAATTCAAQGGVCDLTHCMQGSPGCMCPSVTTLLDNANTAGVSLKWYCPGKGVDGVLWCAPYYTQSGAFGTSFSNTVSTSEFLTDIQNDTLPAISYISPPRASSEHPDATISSMTVHNGVTYVESLIRPCLNKPSCYNTTTFFLTWDDAGGFYDHIPPSSTKDGVRVGVICIGPYCKNKFTTTYLTQVSIRKCVEDFGKLPYLGSLESNTTSICAADGSGMIDLSQTPILAPPPGPVPVLMANHPDVVDGVRWAWNKLHSSKRDRDDDKPLIFALKHRPCDLSTPLRDWAVFKPTGTLMEFCHDKDNNYILAPGQTLDDNEDFEN